MPNAVTLEELRRAEENDERQGWISVFLRTRNCACAN